MPLDNFRPRPQPGDGQRVPGTQPRQPTQPIQPGVITPAPNTGTPSPPVLTPEPPPGSTPIPPRPPYPEPSPPARPPYPENPSNPERPLYPEGPNMGIPGGPGSLTPGPSAGRPTMGVPGGTGSLTPGSSAGGPNMGIPGGPGSLRPPVAGGPPTLDSYLPPGSQFSPGDVVGNSLENLLAPGSRYIDNARQRGREEAGRRGLLNSSIAAGTAERSAIEASMPILDQIMGLHRQREGQAHQSTEAQRDRQFQSEFSLLNANVQDWLNSSQYNREWNGQLAMLPIASAAEMWSGLMQLAASDPTVFTPDVLAGYQDFFQTGFNEYISRYLQPTAPGGT